MLHDKINGNGRRSNGLFVEELEIAPAEQPAAPAMPAPEARPAPRQRPRIVNRTTKPSNEQVEAIDNDLEDLRAMGYTIPRAVYERAMYRAWLAIPLALRVKIAYEQEQDEVERGYGQGACPR